MLLALLAEGKPHIIRAACAAQLAGILRHILRDAILRDAPAADVQPNGAVLASDDGDAKASGEDAEAEAGEIEEIETPGATALDEDNSESGKRGGGDGAPPPRGDGPLDTSGKSSGAHMAATQHILDRKDAADPLHALTAGRMLVMMGCLAVEGEETLVAFWRAQRHLDVSSIGRVTRGWRRYLRSSPSVKARISIKSHFDRVLGAFADDIKPPQLFQPQSAKGGAGWPSQLESCLRRAVGSDASRAQEASHQIQAWAAKVSKLQATVAQKSRLGKQREMLKKAVADPAAKEVQDALGWAVGSSKRVKHAVLQTRLATLIGLEPVKSWVDEQVGVEIGSRRKDGSVSSHPLAYH